jgi:antitoxin YafN
MDEPVAVLSNNKTAGYMVSSEVFEQMVALIESQSKTSRFRPSKARLAQIAAQGSDALLASSDDDLGDLSP